MNQCDDVDGDKERINRKNFQTRITNVFVWCVGQPFSSLLSSLYLSLFPSHPVTSQSSASLNLSIYYINDDALHQKRIIKWLRRKKNICLAFNAFDTYVLLKISKSLILLILEFRRKRLIWRYWNRKKGRKEEKEELFDKKIYLFLFIRDCVHVKQTKSQEEIFTNETRV